MNFDLDSNDLYIDHQITNFDINATYLSWKPVTNPQCNNFEVVSRKRCGSISPVQNTWHSNKLSIGIPATSLSVNGSEGDDKRADILIKALNDPNDFVCNQTKATMQVQNLGKGL